MSVQGKIQAVNTTAPNFTPSNGYPILGLVVDNGSGDVWALTVDDNGDVVSTKGDINGNQFAVTELYAGTKVI